MDYDMACAAFDNALPQDVRDGKYYGSAELAQKRKLQGMRYAQEKRCSDILASLCAWRLAPYNAAMCEAMLATLSQALMCARHVACSLFDYALSCDDESCSAVAVIAPPIKTI